MKKIFPFILMVLLLSSCSKSVLDQLNPNAMPVTQFWKTEDDAQKAVNAIYAMFYQNGSWNRWIYFRLDLTSDEGMSKSPWVELADWTRFNYVNYNFFEGNGNTWRDTYKAIFRANQVLKFVPDIPFADEKKKAAILAQAKFFRALYYYYGALLWENMPVMTDPHLDDPGYTPPAGTLAEVWALVEKDLTEALPDLPEAWDDANVGRPTQGAVNAFLARAYMQQHKWPEAKAALEYFFTGGGKGRYSLVDFKENFRATDENNEESVFEIQFSDANKTGEGDGVNANMGSNRTQFFAPRGIGWSDGQARFWLVQEFKKEKTTDGQIDPRLRYSLFYPDLEKDFGDKVYGKTWAQGKWGPDEAWFKKYSRDYYRTNEDYYSEVNNRLVRYADILLLYAEVLNELGQTATAVPYVNQVRARSKMAPLATAHPTALLSKDNFRERLKMERALELCGESVRWADLKRWGDLETQQKLDVVAQRDPDFKNFTIGKHIRLPLPQTEVLNNPNLKQNPGY